jgi:hypothetical protein
LGRYMERGGESGVGEVETSMASARSVVRRVGRMLKLRLSKDTVPNAELMD